MLRVLSAAVAGGIVIRLWALISPLLLPWPSEFVPPGASVLDPPLNTSSQAPLASADNRAAVPLRGFYRPLHERRAELAPLAQTGVDISIALVIAMAALACPRDASWLRCLAIVGLTGLFAVAICNVSQADRLDWDIQYLLVLCADHSVTVLLTAIAVTAIIHARWPICRSRLPGGT